MKTWPAIDVSFPNLRADDSRPDLFQAALVDYAVAAIDDNAAEHWRVFFHTVDERQRALDGLADSIAGVQLSPTDVPDEDWAARSQANLHAIQVGAIVVAPPWDLVIRIQPSMGFGTGHHATTRLCLDALQQLELRGKSVVDVGTGSGVLAIAASLLGAWPVLGIDDDPDAIQSARENVEMNPAAKVDVQVVDLRTAALGPFDVVVANLTGGLLMQAAARLQELTVRGGYLVVSGLQTHEEPAVMSSLNDTRSEFRRRGEEEGWVCVTLQRL